MEAVATSAKQWKGKIEVQGVPLPLPSDNVALVRQITPQAFLASGMIPDPLSAIINKAISTKKGLPPSEMKKLTQDPKQLASALELFDRVAAHVVIEPPIEMPPPCERDGCGLYANVPVHEDHGAPGFHKYREGPRDPEVLYADQVDMEDKMFIFQWALGATRDLSTFRAELAAGVESLSDG